MNKHDRHDAADAFVQRGQPEQAIPLLVELVEENPTDYRAATNLSYLLYELGKLDEAIRVADKVIGCVSDNQELYGVYLNKGLAHQRSGDLATAESAIRHSLALKPDYAHASVSLARLLTELGETQLASIEYRKLVEKHPEFTEGLNDYGSFLANVFGDSEGAANIFNRCLAVSPHDRKASGNLGIVYVALERYDEAILVLEACITHHPDYLAARHSLAVAYHHNGETHKRNQVLIDAIENSPIEAERMGFLDLLRDALDE